MTGSRVMKWISGGLELGLAIPFIGGAFVLASGYTVLAFMFILHVITLVLSSRNREPNYGSILGIVTSLLAWVPFLGWILHLLSAIFLMVTAAQRSK
ncbi:hypothetical protein [Paenibacillus sp. FJAT-26967]|uniref:hypothetical protein n=1 Tax=Paenibacillus sp. FJAT-26967 TaxID=1729690 RepID=UPI0008383073|nr:hypothetical protein [Paenibacillus sp. FJAT-26967]